MTFEELAASVQDDDTIKAKNGWDIWAVYLAHVFNITKHFGMTFEECPDGHVKLVKETSDSIITVSTDSFHFCPIEGYTLAKICVEEKMVLTGECECEEVGCEHDESCYYEAEFLPVEEQEYTCVDRVNSFAREIVSYMDKDPKMRVIVQALSDKYTHYNIGDNKIEYDYDYNGRNQKFVLDLNSMKVRGASWIDTKNLNLSDMVDVWKRSIRASEYFTDKKQKMPNALKILARKQSSSWSTIWHEYPNMIKVDVDPFGCITLVAEKTEYVVHHHFNRFEAPTKASIIGHLPLESSLDEIVNFIKEDDHALCRAGKRISEKLTNALKGL